MAVMIPTLFWLLSLLCWGYALRFGGAAARWSFALFLLAMMGTTAALLVTESWGHLDLLLFLVDGLYFVGLYVIALRSRRYWPIWAAGFQLLTVLAHFGPLLLPRADPKIYRALETVWQLPLLLVMAVGVAKDRRIGRRTKVLSHEPSGSAPITDDVGSGTGSSQ